MHDLKKEKKKTSEQQKHQKIPTRQENITDRIIEDEYGGSRKMKYDKRSLDISRLKFDITRELRRFVAQWGDG